MPETTPPRLHNRRRIAIANCTLCDDDGYRQLRVCDHIDRDGTYRRGMNAVRAALAATHSHETHTDDTNHAKSSNDSQETK